MFPEQQIRVWFEDEARMGTKPRFKRRLTARGVKPVMVHANTYENFWIYGAFEPASGQSFVMQWSTLDSACFQAYVQHFAQHHHNKQQLHLMVMDGASAHRAHNSDWPATVLPVILPPYSPELNPCERVWQVMRKALKGWYPELDMLRNDLDVWLNNLNAFDLRSTLQFPYIRRVLPLLSSSN